MTLIPSEGKSHHLPCRLQAVAEGMEWFIYNRTPAYDDILRHMQPDLPEALSRHPETGESAPFLNDEETSALPIESERGECFVCLRQCTTTVAYLLFGKPASGTKVRKAKRYVLLPLTPLKPFAKWIYRQLPALDLKETLPIGFEVIRGAITLGNDSTPNVLIGNFKRATGTFGLQPVSCRMESRTPHLSCSLCSRSPDQSSTRTSKFII
jgi:hypothetical protein